MEHTVRLTDGRIHPLSRAKTPNKSVPPVTARIGTGIVRLERLGAQQELGLSGRAAHTLRWPCFGATRTCTLAMVAMRNLDCVGGPVLSLRSSEIG
jgi:hypothetical protein